MAHQDTSIGAGHSAFQSTVWGEILRARNGNPRELRELMTRLAAAYWRPVYKFIRVAWRKDNEEAKDLTQEFFATVFRPEFLARADPARGSFRTFLLASVKNFLRDYEKFKGALKRGGKLQLVPMDAEEFDVLPETSSTPEREFMRSWAESVLSEALRELERNLSTHGRESVFRAFREYCLEVEPGRKVSYQLVAERIGLSVSDVTNHLAEARKELRKLLALKVGAYVGSPDQVDEELRALFEGE